MKKLNSLCKMFLYVLRIRFIYKTNLRTLTRKNGKKENPVYLFNLHMMDMLSLLADCTHICGLSKHVFFYGAAYMCSTLPAQRPGSVKEPKCKNK